ncbi:hypothetical protein BCR44DRAFT_50321 [Catenaria anguillulae PL171]|uniref:Uncharacterized protein n=1 Tax=Catenaria anguillulae PL171 TaxID=765915 RepID=A0A1Y2H4M1_9FUNG|nr:hypothetical protein BCR44DRAFT_50321 [Catenaria anguillulae PL171]
MNSGRDGKGSRMHGDGSGVARVGSTGTDRQQSANTPSANLSSSPMSNLVPTFPSGSAAADADGGRKARFTPATVSSVPTEAAASQVHDSQVSLEPTQVHSSDREPAALDANTSTSSSVPSTDHVDHKSMSRSVPKVTVTVSRVPPSPPSHSPPLPPPARDDVTTTLFTLAPPPIESTAMLLPPSPSRSHCHSPALSSSSSSTSSLSAPSIDPSMPHPPSDSPPPLLPNIPDLPHELMDAILRMSILLPPTAPPNSPTLHPATHILERLLVIGDLSTPTYQCAMLRLPHASSMDTAASLGRTDVLTKRVALGLPVDPQSAYSAVAIDIACELGHVHVLEWFAANKLPLVRSSIALMSASLRAQVGVLEWWRARDTPADVDHPHSLPSVAGYSVWVASRVGEMRSVRWWAGYAMSLADRAVGDRVLVDVLDASLHAATFFGHVEVLEYWAQGWPNWVRHLVIPISESEWGARVPAFAKLEETAAAAAADGIAHDAADQRRPTFMLRWWQRLLGQVGDDQYYFRSAHSQARKDLVRGMQWWVHRGTTAVASEGDAPLVSEAALEHIKQACLRYAPPKVLRRMVREPQHGFLEEVGTSASMGVEEATEQADRVDGPDSGGG